MNLLPGFLHAPIKIPQFVIYSPYVHAGAPKERAQKEKRLLLSLFVSKAFTSGLSACS